jgi:GTP-binding protein
MRYTVAIIGRPNVGKSTLFNRVTNSKKAIVENFPGVTRDRLYEKVTYLEKSFNLIDTGGITLENGNFNDEIKMQAEIAMDESDLVLFVVDGQGGVTKEEEIIANILRQKKKEIIIVVNKVDNEKIRENMYEFYALGFENVIPVSSVHGNGIYDVMEYIYPFINEEEPDDDHIKFSLIGRPNVGKSSLFNALVKQERSIVSNVEGTTRDAIDYIFEENDKTYRIIDTAGIKKRGKIYENVDKYSVLRSLKSIEESDIVLWLIDAKQGIIEQDKRVLGYALEEKKPVIIIVNKWDLIEKETNTQKLYEERLKIDMPFIADAEVLFLSALTTKGVKKIVPVIDELYEKYSRRHTTAQINSVLNEAVSSKIHPSHKGKPVRFYYATQVGSKPPKFLVFVNNTELVHFSYKRYLENYFKRSLGLKGIKLDFVFRNRKED